LAGVFLIALSVTDLRRFRVNGPGLKGFSDRSSMLVRVEMEEEDDLEE